jgi:hypothetical protein
MAHTALSGTARGQTDRWVTVSVGLTAAVVAVGTAGQLIDYGFDLGVGVLDSSGDGGVLGAASQVAMAAASLAAWVLLVRLWPPGVATGALPVLLTVLALTKAVPVAVATLAALVLVARRLSRRSRTLVHAALVLLSVAFLIHVGGEAALERLGAAGDGWAYQLKAVIKHGAEAGGWMLVATALAAGWRPP